MKAEHALIPFIIFLLLGIATSSMHAQEAEIQATVISGDITSPGTQIEILVEVISNTTSQEPCDFVFDLIYNTDFLSFDSIADGDMGFIPNPTLTTNPPQPAAPQERLRFTSRNKVIAGFCFIGLCPNAGLTPTLFTATFEVLQPISCPIPIELLGTGINTGNGTSPLLEDGDPICPTEITTSFLEIPCETAPPTPSITPSPSASPTPSPSVSLTPSPTPSISISSSPSITPTPSPTSLPIVFTTNLQGDPYDANTTFTVDVAVKNNTGAPIGAYTFVVTYDSDSVSLLSVEDIDVGATPTLGSINGSGANTSQTLISAFNINPALTNPTLFRLTFQTSSSPAESHSMIISDHPESEFPLLGVIFGSFDSVLLGISHRFDHTETDPFPKNATSLTTDCLNAQPPPIIISEDFPVSRIYTVDGSESNDISPINLGEMSFELPEVVFQFNIPTANVYNFDIRSNAEIGTFGFEPIVIIFTDCSDPSGTRKLTAISSDNDFHIGFGVGLQPGTHFVAIEGFSERNIGTDVTLSIGFAGELPSPKSVVLTVYNTYSVTVFINFTFSFCILNAFTLNQPFSLAIR